MGYNIDVGICHIYKDVVSNSSVCLSLAGMEYNMDIGICHIHKDVLSKYQCLLEFDKYGVQQGCRNGSHVHGCGK